MQAQWRLVNRSRPKRSNEEDIGISSKRQRRIQSYPESRDECEDIPQIRGGLARPRPPQLGLPPNRAKTPAPQASKTDPTANTAAPSKTPPSQPRIVDSDDEDDDEDWRPQVKPPATTIRPGTTGGVVSTKGTSTTTGPPPGLTGTQGPTKPPIQPPKVQPSKVQPSKVQPPKVQPPKVQPPKVQPPKVQPPKVQPPKVQPPKVQPPKVGANKSPVPPAQGPPQIPTPLNTGPSNNQKQGTGTGTGGPGGTSSTTTTKAPTGPQPPYSQESEILELYRKLQEMVVIWVEECLPDTFPPDFKDNRPERYWELCGWCRPVKLGNAMLLDRSWAKYVYESWVWRFLYGEIIQPGSLAWAGNDMPVGKGGAGGAGTRINDNFKSLFDPKEGFMPGSQYQTRIKERARVMDQVRKGLVKQECYSAVTAGLVSEMLAAFHPYFSDSYKPIDQPHNIEVLIRDTRFLILKARELDEKLRGARNVYDLILGKPGKVCEISGVDSPAVQRYDSAYPAYLKDHLSIALIVVPGLIRFDIEESIYADDDEVKKVVVRHARAFEHADLVAVMPSLI